MHFRMLTVQWNKKHEFLCTCLWFCLHIFHIYVRTFFPSVCSFFPFFSFSPVSVSFNVRNMQTNPIRPFIDTNYTASDNEMQRHRALAIIKPMKNMTGEYSCQVGSYTNEDRRVQHLQMIVPETHFYLNVGKPFGNGGNNLSIECAAKNIYPEPKLTILYVFQSFFRNPFSHFPNISIFFIWVLSLTVRYALTYVYI